MADLDSTLAPAQHSDLATKLAPRTGLRMGPVASSAAIPRAAVLRLLLVALLGVGLAAPVLLRPSEVGAAGSEVLADTAASVRDSLAPRPPAVPSAEGRVPVAGVDGLVLLAPSEHVRMIGFHEAAYADALAFEPQGTIRSNDNTTKFTPPAATDGHRYAVLSSRGRRTAATSAMDIAVEPDTPVTSLVDGTVVSVEGYFLYGRYQDTRIEIAPEARPDLRVVIIHVTDPQVAAGGRVVAGETVVAGAANHFPFRSHIDRYVGDPPGPHVHVEVKRAEGRGGFGGLK
ncbi:MAG: M23 family metallopeptidase [Nitriliruptorales bacterium]